MRIGVTATRHGLNTKQREEAARVMRWFYRGGMTFELHHGCAVGGDTDLHVIARAVFQRDVFIQGWPAKGVPSNIHNLTHDLDRIMAPAPPMDRNVSIVDAIEVLLVAPRARAEEVRSGTWHAFRYARTKGRLTVMLWP